MARKIGCIIPGTKIGGYKAAQANRNKTTVMIDGVPVKIKKGEFYTVVGKIGGKKSTGGGFAANPELASEAGRIGGLKSRKGGSSLPVNKTKVKKLQAELHNRIKSWKGL